MLVCSYAEDIDWLLEIYITAPKRNTVRRMFSWMFEERLCHAGAGNEFWWRDRQIDFYYLFYNMANKPTSSFPLKHYSDPFNQTKITLMIDLQMALDWDQISFSCIFYSNGFTRLSMYMCLIMPHVPPGWPIRKARVISIRDYPSQSQPVCV